VFPCIRCCCCHCSRSITPTHSCSHTHIYSLLPLLAVCMLPAVPPPPPPHVIQMRGASPYHTVCGRLRRLTVSLFSHKPALAYTHSRPFCATDTRSTSTSCPRASAGCAMAQHLHHRRNQRLLPAQTAVFSEVRSEKADTNLAKKEIAKDLNAHILQKARRSVPNYESLAPVDTMFIVRRATHRFILNLGNIQAAFPDWTYVCLECMVRWMASRDHYP
jgi:hypothetical protein